VSQLSRVSQMSQTSQVGSLSHWDTVPSVLPLGQTSNAVTLYDCNRNSNKRAECPTVPTPRECPMGQRSYRTILQQPRTQRA
jgi:hypothetical protein